MNVHLIKLLMYLRVVRFSLHTHIYIDKMKCLFLRRLCVITRIGYSHDDQVSINIKLFVSHLIDSYIYVR